MVMVPSQKKHPKKYHSHAREHEVPHKLVTSFDKMRQMMFHLFPDFIDFYSENTKYHLLINNKIVKILIPKHTVYSTKVNGYCSSLIKDYGVIYVKSYLGSCTGGHK